VKPDVPQIVSEACRATLLWPADGAGPAKEQWGRANAIAGRFVLFATECVRAAVKESQAVLCCGGYVSYVCLGISDCGTQREARNEGIVWRVADSVCFGSELNWLKSDSPAKCTQRQRLRVCRARARRARVVMVRSQRGVGAESDLLMSSLYPLCRGAAPPLGQPRILAVWPCLTIPSVETP
jgi:hypothetical protein